MNEVDYQAGIIVGQLKADLKRAQDELLVTRETLRETQEALGACRAKVEDLLRLIPYERAKGYVTAHYDQGVRGIKVPAEVYHDYECGLTTLQRFVAGPSVDQEGLMFRDARVVAK